MMRLPFQETSNGLDACFVGVPFDLGASNRSGARFGPRQVRSESVLLRPTTWRRARRPSTRCRWPTSVTWRPTRTTSSIPSTASKRAYDAIIANGCRPITIGGDRTIAWPILRAMRQALRPDRRGARRRARRRERHHGRREDRARHAFSPRGGRRPARLPPRGADRPARHRLPRRRLRLVPPSRAFAWCRPRSAGTRSLAPLMKEVIERVAGPSGDGPVYPELRHRRPRPVVRAGHRHAGDRRAHGAAGAGDHPRPARPEPGRCRHRRDLAALRPAGTTALVGANLAYEMLCVMPGVAYRT